MLNCIFLELYIIYYKLYVRFFIFIQNMKFQIVIFSKLFFNFIFQNFKNEKIYIKHQILYVITDILYGMY